MVCGVNFKMVLKYGGTLIHLVLKNNKCKIVIQFDSVAKFHWLFDTLLLSHRFGGGNGSDNSMVAKNAQIKSKVTSSTKLFFFH